MADHQAESRRRVDDGAAEAPAAVELDDVVVAFGDVRALDGVSLRVETGERLAVIGPSGAGKSTLFAVLTRSAPLARGRVRVHGEELFALGPADLRAARRRTGVLDQAYGLVPQLSAGLNVALGELAGAGRRATVRAFFAGPERAMAERAVDALGRLGLADRAGAAAGTLSGGQQQRVAVARMMVQRPDLLLADEPVAAVDRSSAELVLEALDELAEAGATLMLSSHDVALARRLPRVVALRAGQVVFDGPPEGLDERMLGALYAGTDAVPPGRPSAERGSPPRSPSVLAPGAGGREGHGLRAR